MTQIYWGQCHLNLDFLFHEMIERRKNDIVLDPAPFHPQPPSTTTTTTTTTTKKKKNRRHRSSGCSVTRISFPYSLKLLKKKIDPPTFTPFNNNNNNKIEYTNPLGHCHMNFIFLSYESIGRWKKLLSADLATLFTHLQKKNKIK